MNNSDTYTIQSAARTLNAIREVLDGMGEVNSNEAERGDIIALIFEYRQARRALLCVGDEIARVVKPLGVPDGWRGREGK